MQNSKTNKRPLLALPVLVLILLLSLQIRVLAGTQGEWVVKGDKVRYRTSAGYVCGKILEIDGNYYSFNSKGLMQRGWVKKGNKKYR